MGKPIVSKYQSDWDQQGQDMGYEVWLPCKNLQHSCNLNGKKWSN